MCLSSIVHEVETSMISRRSEVGINCSSKDVRAYGDTSVLSRVHITFFLELKGSDNLHT